MPFSDDSDATYGEDCGLESDGIGRSTAVILIVLFGLEFETTVFASVALYVLI
jgi:hypothetical protein